MPEIYTCTQCLWSVPTPICPGCNQFLTDDLDLAESFMEEPEKPGADTIEWCTAFGHWGDVFCCCGLMLNLLAMKKQTKCSVLYVGPDLNIAEWLKQQPFVAEVIAIKVANADVYPKFWQAAARPGTEPNDWLPFLEDQIEHLPKWDKYVQTHVNFRWFKSAGGMKAQLWHGGELSMDARKWARNVLCERLERKGRIFHVHPVSTWSESTRNHWPHWIAAIEWMLANTPHTFVVTGQDEIPFLPQSPRLLNLIGSTPTNQEVLAISELCDGVIATPNNVAIWAVIQRQKLLVIGNKATEFLTSYYRRFLVRGEGTTYLNVDAPYSAFEPIAKKWFEV